MSGSKIPSALQDLQALQDWYVDHCDGDWEHSYGIRIDTLDNPGWSMTVDLIGTELENVPFSPEAYGIDEEDAVQGGNGETDWYVCKRTEAQFVGYGGPRNLPTLIKLFITWVEESVREGHTTRNWNNRDRH